MPHTVVVKSYQNQNYEQIRQKCLSRDELFTDSKFAADETSIYRAAAASSNINIISDGRNIVWKRPNEFLENPVFVLRDSIDWSNLVQGDLGNW